jgi:hypothetical protein
MKPAFLAPILAILAIAAAATPMIAQAGVDDQYSAAHVYRTTLRHAAAPQVQRPLWMMDLTPRKALQRPYGKSAEAPAPEQMPTAVSYRITPNGPVGSVGLVRMDASHAVDPSALSNAVANQPGAPSQTVGAALAYAFR